MKKKLTAILLGAGHRGVTELAELKEFLTEKFGPSHPGERDRS